MNNKYISICGYTQEELESSFKEYIESTAEYMAISKEELLSKIKYSKDNKLEEKLKEAMNQIRNNRYYEKYINNNPILLAIVFSENKDIACRFENV
jgi:hypothetical protein